MYIKTFYLGFLDCGFSDGALNPGEQKKDSITTQHPSTQNQYIKLLQLYIVYKMTLYYASIFFYLNRKEAVL